jgi:hypothetical protein
MDGSINRPVNVWMCVWWYLTRMHQHVGDLEWSATGGTRFKCNTRVRWIEWICACVSTLRGRSAFVYCIAFTIAAPHTYTHSYIPTYNIHTYIHTYIRTYIHTYIRTYIHTYMQQHEEPAEPPWYTPLMYNHAAAARWLRGLDFHLCFNWQPDLSKRNYTKRVATWNYQYLAQAVDNVVSALGHDSIDVKRVTLVCVFVCMYACMHVCMYVCTYGVFYQADSGTSCRLFKPRKSCNRVEQRCRYGAASMNGAVFYYTTRRSVWIHVNAGNTHHLSHLSKHTASVYSI